MPDTVRTDTAAHPNVAVIDRLYDAFRRRDRDALEALLTDDCRWEIPGRGGQAGVYVGRDAVVDLFRRITKQTAGSAAFDVDEVIANDDCAVVLQRGRGTIEGRSAELDECLVYRIRDGRVAGMKEFQFDLYELDEWLEDSW